MTQETDAGGDTRSPVYDAAGEIVAWRTANGGVRPAESPSGPLPHRVPRTPAELELGDLAAEILENAPLASPGIEPLLAGGASIYSHLFSERDPRAQVRRDELNLLVEERGLQRRRAGGRTRRTAGCAGTRTTTAVATSSSSPAATCATSRETRWGGRSATNTR
ncbi:hypothetical protein [Nannocystis pusilla]|uniref:hypothetical protein n=1 Tax=Nannocystis pusilla TaxID=889268 RepID=UPI003B7AA977